MAARPRTGTGKACQAAVQALVALLETSAGGLLKLVVDALGHIGDSYAIQPLPCLSADAKQRRTAKLEKAKWRVDYNSDSL